MIERVPRAAMVAILFSVGAPGAVAQPSAADQARFALADLGPRFAQEFDLKNGWYRGTQIRYYDFGPVPQGVSIVYWPIHGFGLDGQPVPLRGQGPVFSTIPGVRGYTSLWVLRYVVVADRVKPNQLTSVAQIVALISSARATIRDARDTLNLPIVPRGSFLQERKDTPPAHGWFNGVEVAYFDFGVASTRAAPIFPFARGSSSDPMPVDGQRNVVDVIPDGTSPSIDLWDVFRVIVDTAYRANTIRDVNALRAAERAGQVTVTRVGSIRNCPVALIEDRPVPRADGPLTRYAIPAVSPK
jgi:hypothetical protein